jgi:hypothetical protein
LHVRCVTPYLGEKTDMLKKKPLCAQSLFLVVPSGNFLCTNFIGSLCEILNVKAQMDETIGSGLEQFS